MVLCDRLSALPDSLIAMILSYLPVNDSVKTSVLSKRWEFLWLNAPILDVDAVNFFSGSSYSEALVMFMDKFLEFNRGSCLQKFKIKYANYRSPKHSWTKEGEYVDSADTEYQKRVMEWIAEVVHRGVQHLDVEAKMCGMIHYDPFLGTNMPSPCFGFKTHSPPVDFMPKYVYVSETLVSLKLVNVGLEDPKFVVSLPSLKIMHLENIRYMSHGGLLIVKRLISASPVLEDLTLDFPKLTEPRQIGFWEECSVSTKPKQIGLSRDFCCTSTSPEEIDLTNVPRCLISTLEYVKINKLRMKEESGSKVVKYFLENSAVLKKLNLSLTHSSISEQELESYKELLTSTKLSRSCQVFVIHLPLST